MEISIGVYAVVLTFFFVIIPGFIARRAYFHGEFSKQVNWNNLSIGSILSSFFIGIIVLAISVKIFNTVGFDRIDVDVFLNKFDSLILSKDQVSAEIKDHKFDGFSYSIKKYYLPFAFSLYLFSAFTSFLLSHCITLFNLDLKYKFFRFGNTWHYLFSGRILRIKKNILLNSTPIRKVKNTYLDILVQEQGDRATLYSGLFADYEVSYNDINKLEKIHLYKPIRYKKTDTGVITREIPGDIFTILGDKIININSRYVFYEIEEVPQNKYGVKKYTLLFFNIIYLILFVFFSISLFTRLSFIKSEVYTSVLQHSIIYKILIVFTANIIGGVLIPFKDNVAEQKVVFNGWTTVIMQLILFFIFSLMVYFFY